MEPTLGGPESAATASRLMVIMFTDLADSTLIKGRLGAVAYAALARAHDDLFRAIVASVPGAEVLKDIGDGFMARFATASSAVESALRFQHALRARDPRLPEGLAFRVRIGLHLGEVADLGSDIYGKTKVIGLAADLAARVMGLATPGQVLMTRAAFDDARQYVREHPPVGTDAKPPPALRWVAHGPYVFKGADEPIEVFEVGAEGAAPLAAPPDSDKAKRAARYDELETLGWRPASGLEIPRRKGWFLQRKLGEGGFGEVWLASQKASGSTRVFKFCFDADRLRSFKREVTLFKLIRQSLGSRDDIAELFEVQLEQPPFFLESEYAAGGNLLDWSARAGGIGTVPPAKRIDIVRRVAEAVAAAHSLGILHKDIKPANILMHEAQGGVYQPRLADFGIGVLVDKSQLAARNITVAGMTMSGLTENQSSRTGTRLYAPPESDQGRAFTVQGDVYALGVLLYQMVVGDLQRPLATGWARDVEDPILAEDIALSVDGDPARRLGSASEFAKRLASLDSRRQALEASLTRRERERRRQRRTRIVGACAAALAGLMVLVGLGWYRERAMHADTAAARDRSDKFGQFLVKVFEAGAPIHASSGKFDFSKMLDEVAKDSSALDGGDPDTALRLRLAMARFLHANSRLDDALAHLRGAEKHITPPETNTAIDALILRSKVLLDLKQPDDALAVAARAIAAVESRPAPAPGASAKDITPAITNLATALQDAGRLPQALEQFRLAVRLRRDHGTKQSLASALANLATCLGRSGASSDAVSALREALALASAPDAKPWPGLVATIQIGLIEQLGAQGEVAEARAIGRAAFDTLHAGSSEERARRQGLMARLSTALAAAGLADEASRWPRPAPEPEPAGPPAGR